MADNRVYLASAWGPGCTEKITIAPSAEEIEVATLKGFECIFANILNVVVRLAGIALFVMLLVGGIKLMTAGGDAKKAESAQKTLTYAIIGLVTIIGTWFIFLLIKTFTGVDVLKFEIFTK